MDSHQQDEFETKIEHVVERCIDTRLKKLLISVWTMIIGGAGSLIFLGIQWGSIKTTVANNDKRDDEHHHDQGLHMPIDKKFETFVTRAEWAALIRERERDIDDLKEELMRVNVKLDKLSDNLLPKNGNGNGLGLK